MPFHRVSHLRYRRLWLWEFGGMIRLLPIRVGLDHRWTWPCSLPMAEVSVELKARYERRWRGRGNDEGRGVDGEGGRGEEITGWRECSSRWSDGKTPMWKKTEWKKREWKKREGKEQGEKRAARWRRRGSHRVGSQVISHIGPIIIPNQNRHIILNSNIIRKNVHIPMISIYPLAHFHHPEYCSLPTCSASWYNFFNPGSSSRWIAKGSSLASFESLAR